MNHPSKASARYEVRPEETYRIPCLTCERRARRWRTVAAVSQWVALSGFTVTMGFAASQLQHAAARVDPATECPRATLALAELKRAQPAAPNTALATVEAAPLRAVVAPNGEGTLPNRLSCEAQRGGTQDEHRLHPSPTLAKSEGLDSEEKPVRQVEDAPAESDSGLNSDSSDSPEVDEESLYPAPAPSAKSGTAGVDEDPDSSSLKPARATSDAHNSQRLRQHLAEGRRLFRQGQLESAELAFRHALALRRGHPQGLTGLARLYLAKGDIDRAKAFAQAAVDRAPYQAPYHVVLGDVLRVASDPEGAEAQYRLATRLNPSAQLDRVARSLPSNPF